MEGVLCFGNCDLYNYILMKMINAYIFDVFCMHVSLL